MTKTSTLLFICLSLFLIGCKDSKSEKKTYYRAINGKDTAHLSITFHDAYFFGEYEMIYGKRGKDSGTVRGKRYGDTLKGEYKYLSYGGSKTIAPFAALKKKGEFHLGRGVKSTYMNIPFYVKYIPINYDLGFTFEEIAEPVKKQ